MKPATLITALLLAAATLPAQAQVPTGTALSCRTSDGFVTIQSDEILFRDYTFTPDTLLEGGVLHLVDRRTGAEAVLDVRSDEGVYFVVIEGSLAMQVVWPRSSMTLRSDGPSSPISAVSLPAPLDLVLFTRSGRTTAMK
ncbi:MAG: hypothetical protein QHI48_06845 [Bacteroidota bacterium]|nr:hypothetical protein [Bacteroidota bacterium]